MIVQRHHTENYLLFEHFYSVFPELDPLLEERERYFSADDLEERLFALHPHKRFGITKTVYEEEIQNGNIIRIGDGNADIYRLDQKTGKWINANGKAANPTTLKRITAKIEAARANRVATVERAAAAGNFAGAQQTKQEFLDTANSYGAGTNMKDKVARQRQQDLASVEREGKGNLKKYMSKSKKGKLNTQAMERDGVLNPVTAVGGEGATNKAGKKSRKQLRNEARRTGVFRNRGNESTSQIGIEKIVNDPKNQPHYAQRRQAAQTSAYNNAVNNQATLRDLAQTNPSAQNNIKEVLPPAPEPKPQFKAKVTGLRYIKPEPKPEVKPELKPEVKPTPVKPRNIIREGAGQAKKGFFDSLYKNGKLTTAGKIGAGVAAATALGGGLYAYSHHKDKQK